MNPHDPRPPPWWKPTKPNGERRAHWWDYRSRAIYMLTLGKSDPFPRFCEITKDSICKKPTPLVTLTPVGSTIARAIDIYMTKFPSISILKSRIMPDHIHLLVFVFATGLHGEFATFATESGRLFISP